jgi:hypothetical protein
MEIKLTLMNKFNKVNKLLMDWNPLGVTGPALSDEYKGLVSLILSKEGIQDLEIFLKQILSKKYGIEYEDFDLVEKIVFNKIIFDLSEVIFE